MVKSVCNLLVLMAALLSGPAGTDRPGPPDATRPLPFHYDLYTFRGASGTEIVAAYAVEAGQLEREPSPAGVRYRFDVSLMLVDTLTRRVQARHDSVYVDARRPLPSDHLLFTTVELETAPSRSTVQRVYMYNATAPGIGQFYAEPFPIPDYSGDALMLSDVALAQPDASGGWQRGTVQLALLPGRRFPGSEFDVYYEIYNLPRGHEYITEIAVDEVGGDATGSRRLVRLQFEGEAAGTDEDAVAELRRVETSLPRGRYRIEVTVTDPVTGAIASSAREFEVHAGGRGASMVPALPVTAAISPPS
ncbi:MAG TPA: hypothetical protein VK929_02230 [Longimicrobiales bacterium]|nr:hypothetical protein [Longimicrobiales bacterium]